LGTDPYMLRAMSRLSVSSLILLLLLPAVAFAAPAPKQRHPGHVKRWNYGFLPGYHQPPSNTIPILGPVGSVRRNSPDYVPSYYGYDGNRYYFGEPGFWRGRYNGGSYGPCWTITPIGRVWNCGQ
jgi:hypothetical protein